MTERRLELPATPRTLNTMDLSNAKSPAESRTRAALRSPAGHFIRHYLEMVAVMFAGMGIFFWPTDALFSALAIGDDTLVMLLSMGVSMTVPMVAWMLVRGHGWRLSLEMGAAMVIPIAGVIVLLVTSVVDDGGMLMVLEHLVMLPAMLVAMLLRRDEYSGRAGHCQA